MVIDPPVFAGYILAINDRWALLRIVYRDWVANYPDLYIVFLWVFKLMLPRPIRFQRGKWQWRLRLGLVRRKY